VAFEGFSPDSFHFYSELEQNNTKVWWEANKARYETHVRKPLTELLEQLAPEFGSGKVYRPYRDTRFSLDKTPYKDRAAAALFGAGATGLYIEVSARGLDLGGGYWMPGKDQLDKFRDLINDPRYFGDLEAEVETQAEAGFQLYQGDALKTAPRGFTEDHPRIHLLRLKHMVQEKQQVPAEWMYTAAAADRIATEWRVVTEWNQWLLDNVGPSSLAPRPR